MCIEETFLEHFGECLAQNFRDENFTDITIKIGDKCFPCHKIILASWSPFFSAMFTSGMKEAHQMEVELDMLCPLAFEEILSMFYFEKDIFHPAVDLSDKIDNLLFASSYLQIPYMEDECINWIGLNLHTAEDAFRYLDMAAKLSLPLETLKSVCYDMIAEDFVASSKMESFLNLSLDEVTLILEHDRLEVVPSNNDQSKGFEDNVCQAVLRWIAHNPKQRKVYMFKLFQLVRLHLTSDSYFLNHFVHNPLVAEADSMSEYVEEVKEYHKIPSQQQNFTSEHVLHRPRSKLQDVVMVVFNNHPEIFAYSVEENKWYGLPRIPFNPGSGFALCNYGRDKVYLSGGDLDGRRVFEFKGESGVWVLWEEGFHYERMNHSMVVVGHDLYAVGGRKDSFDMDNIEKHDSVVDRWDVVSGSYFEKPVDSKIIYRISAFSVGMRIFFIAESDKLNKIAKENGLCLLGFDTRFNQRTYITHLNIPFQISAVVRHRDTIFIVTNGLKSVLMISGGGFTVKPYGMMLNKVDGQDEEYYFNFGAVKWKNKILTFGGSDTFSFECKDVEEFDLDSMQTRTVNYLRADRGECRSINVTVGSTALKDLHDG